MVVDRVSEPELQSPEERPVLFDREALIASLQNDERIRALREALADAEKDMVAHIATVMLTTKGEIDQRKIDYTRGYFAGASYWLGRRMTDASTRLNAQAKKAEGVDPRTKESDTSVEP